MYKFIFSFQFLTIFPLKTRKTPDTDTISGSVIYFPLVGLILGLILAGLNNFFLFLNFTPLLTSIILVIALIILTGGLHLDGLADTFDALGSFKDRESCLRIMKDSHIGTMGVLSLISIILLKVGLLSCLDSNVRNVALILMCTISRWSLSLPMWRFPYAREEGKGKVFFEGMNSKIFLGASSIALVCAAYIFRLKGILIFLIAGIFAYIFSWFISRKIGGITGDILGAINEISEVFVLLTIQILSRMLGEGQFL